MKLETVQQGGVRLIRPLEERLDAPAAVAFKDAMRLALDGCGGPFVLDLSRIGFLDSSGLGALVAVLKLVGSERELMLVGITPAVDRVFRLTRMDTVFRCLPGIEDAIAAASPGGRVDDVHA